MTKRLEETAAGPKASKERRAKTSQYVGVSKQGQRWVAQFLFKRKKTYVGRYDTELEAAQAYNKFVKQFYLLNRDERIVHRLNFDETVEIESAAGASTTPEDQPKRSKYVGVAWHKIQKKWHARFTVDKKTYSCGIFNAELEAAHAYDAAVKKFYDENPDRPVAHKPNFIVISRESAQTAHGPQHSSSSSAQAAADLLDVWEEVPALETLETNQSHIEEYNIERHQQTNYYAAQASAAAHAQTSSPPIDDVEAPEVLTSPNTRAMQWLIGGDWLDDNREVDGDVPTIELPRQVRDNRGYTPGLVPAYTPSPVVAEHSSPLLFRSEAQNLLYLMDSGPRKNNQVASDTTSDQQMSAPENPTSQFVSLFPGAQVYSQTAFFVRPIPTPGSFTSYFQASMQSATSNNQQGTGNLSRKRPYPYSPH